VERPDFEILRGDLRRVHFAQRIRAFAACCGTQVLFEESAHNPKVDVAIATLDDPAPFPPAKAIWVEDKLPWVTLEPNTPSFVKSSGPTLL
jgi:hypothetical protein